MKMEEISGWNQEDTTATMSRLVRFADAVRADSELGERVASDPAGVLEERGFALPQGLDVQIVSNTPETFHVVLPPDPNEVLSDEDLAVVAGGKSASTAGTGGTGSSAGTFPTCVSSVGTAGSVGSAGSEG